MNLFESGLCVFIHNDINFSNSAIYIFKKNTTCTVYITGEQNKTRFYEVKFIETKFCIFPGQFDSNIFWSILASLHNHIVHLYKIN